VLGADRPIFELEAMTPGSRQVNGNAHDDAGAGAAGPTAISMRFVPAMSAGARFTLAFCWAHLRRRFFDIVQGGPAPIASEALERIAALYAIEKTIRGRSAGDRRAMRQKKSKPLVLALKAWLEQQLTRVSGKPPSSVTPKSSRQSSAVRRPLSVQRRLVVLELGNQQGASCCGLLKGFFDALQAHRHRHMFAAVVKKLGLFGSAITCRAKARASMRACSSRSPRCATVC
jgi:Transposase IS66 family